MNDTLEVGILGGGSFGTAIANLLASNGHRVELWMHDADRVHDVNTLRENRKYLPGLRLEDGIHATGDLEEAVAGKPLVVAVSPSHVTRGVMTSAAPFLEADAAVVCATKGIESDRLKLMCEVMDEVLPEPNRARTAYISGPSFAKEMVQKLPTVVSVASHSPEVGQAVQQAFNSDYFRVYTADDVIGVEVAGAAKNVMAIAAGISDGLGFGHNTRAALISRGLAEMSRLGIRMGGHAITFMGLAGVGDLVLTCTGDLSRNRSVGLKVGAGKSLAEVLGEMNQVAEGVNTAKALHALARQIDVEMPIVEAVYQILYEGKSARRAVGELMARPLKHERG